MTQKSLETKFPSSLHICSRNHSDRGYRLILHNARPKTEMTKYQECLYSVQALLYFRISLERVGTKHRYRRGSNVYIFKT